MKEKILIICAHSDDEVVGMGGTLLKYKKEGNEVLSVIFSYGEKSHPHLQEGFVARKRIQETRKVDKLTGRRSVFFGLREGRMKEEAKNKNIKKRLRHIITKYKPDKIYITSSVDVHPDHKAVNKIVIETLDEMKYKNDLYSFEIWNITNENKPCVYVDITSTFQKKIRLLKEFESQKIFIYPFILVVFFRALKYGWKAKCRYAEKFCKLR